MDRAGKTDVREDQQMFLDARGTLMAERPALMAEFERQLRKIIDERVSGKTEPKADFSKVDASKLTLVETVSMDEAVLTGNITRVVENLCHDELVALNRGVGYLLGQPDLPTDGNPLGPATIVGAFSQAVNSLKTDRKIKFQIMKDLNQAQLGDINAIYAYLNEHLTRLNMMPSHSRTSINRDRNAPPGPDKKAGAKAPPPAGPAEVDVMAMFKRMYGSATPPPQASSMMPQMPQMPQMQGPGGGFSQQPSSPDDLPVISMPQMPAPSQAFPPMRPTPS